MPPAPSPSVLESDGDYVEVRYRDPGAFETVRTPEWAEKAADSVVEGGVVRVGKRPDGDGWEPLSVRIPDPASPEAARRQADEILQRIAD